jgi:hypothetical protein
MPQNGNPITPVLQALDCDDSTRRHATGARMTGTAGIDSAP